MVKKDKYVVFHVQGGLGKNVMATAVIPAIKKKYEDRKLIVVASWPEVFLYHPQVWRPYKLGMTNYFYQDFIENQDVVILKGEPYDRTDHILQKQHVIQSWHETFDLEYEDTWPELHSNYRFLQLIYEKYRRDKPIMILQSNGGPMQRAKVLSSWSRDMPKHVAQKIVNHYKDKYHIYQIAWHKDHVVKGAEPLLEGTWNMEMLQLVRLADKRILIDSCMQHAAAAFELPSTVLWIGTSPTVFGYEVHQNIITTAPKFNAEKNPHAYLFNYELWGDPIQCPYENDHLFDVDEIIQKSDELDQVGP